MRCTLVLLRRALHRVALMALALAALSGCASPLRLATTPGPAAATQIVVVPTAALAPSQPPEAATTATVSLNCTPTATQPAPGEPITLLARVAGCPGLVRVEWRAEVLIVPVGLLGLRERDLVGLPEEVR